MALGFFTKISDFFKGFNVVQDPNTKSFLKMVGISVVGVGFVCGAIFLFYKWEADKSANALAAATSAAYAKGVADTNAAAANAANAQLQQAILNLQKLEQQTQNQLAQVQATTDAEKAKIDSFNVDALIVNHPDQVEKWSNDTNNGLFSDLTKDSQ